MFFRFLKVLGVTTACAWLGLLPFLYVYAQSPVVWGTTVGWLLPVICFVPGFYAIAWAYDRPLRPFLLAVFGGMLARLCFIGVSVVLLLKLTALHVPSLLLSLVGFYILYLAIEIYFLNRRPSIGG